MPSPFCLLAFFFALSYGFVLFTGLFNGNSPGLIPFNMVGQLQQQQNLLNLNQSYQYMMQQQMDTVDRLRRIEVLLTGGDYYDGRPPGSLYSSPQNPYSNRLNNNNTAGGLPRAPLGQTFTFEPQPFRQESVPHMMESPSSQQTVRLNRDQMVHNQLNSKSGARPKEYPQSNSQPVHSTLSNQQVGKCEGPVL